MQQRESITIDGIKFNRYPEATCRTNRLYFKTARNGKTMYLHRYIWEQANGEIPKGIIVHHEDEDYDNNELENLIAMSTKDHARLHVDRRTPEQIEASRKNMDKARVFASKWHQSPEGRAWHKIIGKMAWDNVEYFSMNCENCGKEFQTRATHGNTKFCSNACKSAWRRKAGLDNVQRICKRPDCGKEFTVNKYAKREYCSRKCVHNI